MHAKHKEQEQKSKAAKHVWNIKQAVRDWLETQGQTGNDHKPSHSYVGTLRTSELTRVWMVLILITPYSMNRLFSELFRKFGGAFLEVFEGGSI